jgi:hypothetical protein
VVQRPRTDQQKSAGRPAERLRHGADAGCADLIADALRQTVTGLG